MRYRHSIVLHAQRTRLFDAEIHMCPDFVMVKRDRIPYLL